MSRKSPPPPLRDGGQVKTIYGLVSFSLLVGNLQVVSDLKRSKDTVRPNARDVLIRLALNCSDERHVYTLWIDDCDPEGKCPLGHTAAHLCPDAVGRAQDTASLIKANELAKQVQLNSSFSSQ